MKGYSSILCPDYFFKLFSKFSFIHRVLCNYMVMYIRLFTSKASAPHSLFYIYGNGAVAELICNHYNSIIYLPCSFYNELYIVCVYSFFNKLQTYLGTKIDQTWNGLCVFSVYTYQTVCPTLHGLHLHLFYELGIGKIFFNLFVYITSAFKTRILPKRWTKNWFF